MIGGGGGHPGRAGGEGDASAPEEPLRGDGEPVGLTTVAGGLLVLGGVMRVQRA